MSSFIVLNVILFGVYLILTLVYTILLRSISFKPAFLLFFDRYFDIHVVPKEESNNLVLDVYGTEVKVSESRRFRISLHVLGVSCLYIVTVVFFDGCILTTSILPPTEPCPSDPNTICFLFQAMTESPWTQFDCPPGLSAISGSNRTASSVICYTWMIKSQGVIPILNQLGICCSILSLLGFIFRFFYRLAFRARWGRLLTIFLATFLIIIAAILTFIVPMTISYISLVLSMAAGCLLFNALYLSRLVNKFKKTSSNSVGIEKTVTSN